MIGRLRGILAYKQPPELLIDVQGVFYELLAPMSSFYPLPKEGETVTLHTHLSIREDKHSLFGFITEQERALFRALIRVSGIGPKLALTILSGIDPDAFVRLVQSGDSSSLTAIPGIGKKTASRLVLETKDALDKWYDPFTSTSSIPSTTSDQQARHDALAALTALGYKAQEANKALTKIDTSNLSREDIIRLALKEMMV